MRHFNHEIDRLDVETLRLKLKKPKKRKTLKKHITRNINQESQMLLRFNDRRRKCSKRVKVNSNHVNVTATAVVQEVRSLRAEGRYRR